MWWNDIIITWVEEYSDRNTVSAKIKDQMKQFCRPNNWGRFLGVSDVYLWLWVRGKPFSKLHLVSISVWFKADWVLLSTWYLKGFFESELKARTHLFSIRCTVQGKWCYSRIKKMVYRYIIFCTRTIYTNICMHVHLMFWTIHSSVKNSFQFKFVVQCNNYCTIVWTVWPAEWVACHTNQKGGLLVFFWVVASLALRTSSCHACKLPEY